MRSNWKDHKMSNTIMALRTERWSYIIALIIVAALILLVVINTVFNLFDMAKQAVVSQREISSIISLHTQIKPDLNIKRTNISDLALFGTAPSGVEAATNTNFTLLGIQYSPSHPDMAKAIINTGSNDGIFGVGDKLNSNVSIDQITPDTVFITQNGIKQKLSITWEGESLISHKFEPVNLKTDNRPGYQIPHSIPKPPASMQPGASGFPQFNNPNSVREKYLNMQKELQTLQGIN